MTGLASLDENVMRGMHHPDYPVLMCNPRIKTGYDRVLPSLRSVLSVKASGASAWASAYRVDVEHLDGSTESYFMKVP